jgi:hypothetical protein
LTHGGLPPTRPRIEFSRGGQEKSQLREQRPKQWQRSIPRLIISPTERRSLLLIARLAIPALLAIYSYMHHGGWIIW